MAPRFASVFAVCHTRPASLCNVLSVLASLRFALRFYSTEISIVDVQIIDIYSTRYDSLVRTYTFDRDGGRESNQNDDDDAEERLSTFGKARQGTQAFIPTVIAVGDAQVARRVIVVRYRHLGGRGRVL